MADGLLKDTMVTMKWTDIEALVNKDALVLLPLGVIEEHGPHLCLGTDILTAHLYCLSIKEKLEREGHSVVLAPSFYWGVCQSTGGFIGSFKIRKETAKALLFDILASLAEFGFKHVFGVNAHGDIDHSIAIIEAFKDASEQLGIHACYAFDEWRITHFGLTGQEPFLCPIKPQTLVVSTAEATDVHAGDIETAIIHTHYPHLVDVKTANSLPPVALKDENGMQWLFGGYIKELSSQGYLGTPSNFRNVDAHAHIEDQASRIAEAILGRIIDYKIIPMTTEYAAMISSWQYMNEYSLYSMDNTDACHSELLNGEYFVVLDNDVEPIGYFCFGESAQVPAGKQHGVYGSNLYMDIGLGMNPALCGHGKGHAFILSGIRYAKQRLAAPAFRLTVARLNQRAITVYTKIGFKEVHSFIRETANECMEFAVMCLGE